MLRLTLKAILVAAVLMIPVGHTSAQSFQLKEASISDIHAAMRAGTLTCHALVQQYLKRIEMYDQQGPKLNAMIFVNPMALRQADAMDQEFKRTGKLKPL